MGHWRGYCVETCEDKLFVDHAYLKRKGYLVPGARKTLSWSSGGEASGKITVVGGIAGIRLIYKTSSGIADWKDVDEYVPFTWTRTRFGGRRQWLECPKCIRPCRILYGGPRFRCRRCHGLHYNSQYQAPGLGAVDQAEKLRKRLGDTVGSVFEGDPFPDKPKGMHWKTYWRLEQRYEAYDNQWSLEAMRRFGMRL